MLAYSMIEAYDSMIKIQIFRIGIDTDSHRHTITACRVRVIVSLSSTN
jgi:hypothetical protein